MDLQDMRIFARVAALENLSAVATQLRLTPGTISKRIQALESDLKVRLFDRTTRSIRITDEGRAFLAHIEVALAEIELARSAVSEVVGRPKGRIRVTAPASFGRDYVAPAICNFLDDYPEVDVQIDLTDSVVNLQEAGYDLAIRTGELSDSSLIAKRLAPDRQLVVAAPQYIAKYGTPKTPAELESHACLIHGDNWQWSFVKGGDAFSLRVKGRLQSNCGDMLRHAALAGQGVYRASEFQVAKDLQDGRLVPLLEDYGVKSSAAIWAIYPSSKHLLPKLRVFLDALAEWFRAQSQKSAVGESVPMDLLVAERERQGWSAPRNRSANR